MAKKNSNSTSLESAAAGQQSPEQQPAEGGSYTRCAESGELTLVARTSHEIELDKATDVTIDFDSTTI